MKYTTVIFFFFLGGGIFFNVYSKMSVSHQKKDERVVSMHILLLVWQGLRTLGTLLHDATQITDVVYFI